MCLLLYFVRYCTLCPIKTDTDVGHYNFDSFWQKCQVVSFISASPLHYLGKQDPRKLCLFIITLHIALQPNTKTH